MRETISADDPDPTMAAALPPGAWWQRANTGAWHGAAEPYGPHAGDAAILAAQRGDLRLQNVSFSYPMRPKMAGERLGATSPCAARQGSNACQ